MSFATALDVVPEPYQVAGTPLKPFCLGHHLLLKRIGSPLTESPFAIAEDSDLFSAIAICAGQSYEWTLDAMMSGEWADTIARWQKRLAGSWWNRRRVNWNEAQQVFRLYLHDGYKSPPIFRRSPGGLELTAPWECLLICDLARAGFSESETLNGYLPARWYYYFTAAEIKQIDEMRELALHGCDKTWRKIFNTQADYERMAAV